MKKLLLTLTLLLGLGFAANAETKTLVLTTDNLGLTGTSYTTKTVNNIDNTGFDIVVRAAKNSGIAFNKAQNNCFLMVTGNANNYNITSVTIQFGISQKKTSEIKVYKSENEYTVGSNDAGSVSNVTATELVATYQADEAAHTAEIGTGYFGLAYNGSNMAAMSSITISYEEAVVSNVPTPVISVEEGKDATNFIGSIDATVSVTPAEGQNLTLKYTLDGSAPAADNGTVVENNGVVTVTENCTLKVIAIDDATNETSAVASKTFKKFEGQVGIAGLVNVLVEDNVTDQKQAKTYDVFLDNAVVIFVDGANAYIQDADASILMYKYSHGYKAGDVLNGVASIKGFMYHGLPEITSVSGAVKTTGGEIPEALEMTIAEVNAMSDPAGYSRLITIKGVYPQSSKEDGSRNVVFEKDGESIALHAQYTNLFPADLDVNRAYNIAGFLANYEGTKQINFSKAERIELLPDDRKDPALDFAEASISLDLNDMEELSTLGLTMAEGFDGEIVWASDNADAVAVEDGYYLVYGLGNATLTASFAGNREWKASEAALNVTVETKVLGISYAMAGGFKAIDLEYTVHVKNHAEGSSYKLVLTVDGEAQDAIELDAPVAVDNAAGAPARAANKGTSGSSEGATHSISGTCKIPFESEIDNTVAHTIKMAVHMNDAATALYETEEISQRTTTGIEDVAVDAEQAAPEYYTLQGVRVAQPEAGQIYIVRRGADVAKELVK